MPTRTAAPSEHQMKKHNIDVWDMGRMLKFIEQESEQKAHEILVKANEEYAIRIAELAVQSTKKISQQKVEEMNKIRSECIIAEGKLRSNALLTLAAAREKVINRIMEEACRAVSEEPLSEEVAKNTIERFRSILPNEEMFVHVLEKDKAVVEKLLRNAKYTYAKMDSSLLGGIVIHNALRTVLVNNSYIERVRKTETKIMPAIRKALFK